MMSVDKRPGFSWAQVRGLHVAFAAFAWFACTAWLRPLTAPDEGRYVGVALHMLQSGDWLVPRLDGLPFFHKPPLFYWLGAVSMQVFGVNEWAARVPSFIGATVAVVSLFVFVRRRVDDPRIAALSALVLATMPYTYIGAQFANLDMLVAGMLSATLCAIAEAVLLLLEGRAWKRAANVAFAFAALAVLAKGLIGLVLPLAVIGVWAVRPSTWRRLLPLMFYVQGWLLFAVIALPWFVAMQLHYPAFFDYFIVTQHFRRFAQTGFNNAQPFWFFVPVIALLGLPWPAWAMSGLRAGWRSRLAGRKVFSSGTVGQFMLAWFAVVLVFFSIPQSKLIGYVLPVLPPAAFFLARWVVFAMDESHRARVLMKWTSGVAAIACVAIAAALAVREDKTDGAVIRAVAAQVKPGDRVLMVDDFHYDVPFYWRLTRNVEVAGDWTQSVATARDNWRKELYDSASFDPQLREQLLVSPGIIASAMCGPGTTWILGNPKLPAFRTIAPVMSRGSVAVWRFDGKQGSKEGCPQPAAPGAPA